MSSDFDIVLAIFILFLTGLLPTRDEAAAERRDNELLVLTKR